MEKRIFEPQPTNVAEVRRFVTDAIADVPVDLPTVALLTSELATNAVRHAKGAFEVRVVPRPDRVRVEVVNDQPDLVLAMKEPSEDAEGGRGLHIVHELADDWGYDLGSEEKVVWFELHA